MAIKKSELYSSLWKSCDELRGGMDASQYKDYVLVLLFMKYVSDRYEGKEDALIEIPKGGSFKDMVALKGNKDIGEGINTIIANLAEANELKGVIDVADFDDDDKLGKGKDKQDRLSNLISIFEHPSLNFSKNRAEGDDLLGDAYEYLMRNFATESGKSKGQFYTPAEVSRIMAKVIGINKAKSQDQTIYDMTCGSGSLLLKAADESERGVTIYGQEMDNATAALAKMNMILHDNPSAVIWQDNTLSKPYFKNPDGKLKTFDFCVANPPFSTKAWSNGLDPANDEYKRFEDGIPPKKNGDYAFLLHMIKSLKSTGKGAIILPHGVLFRGGAEGEIRKNVIRKGYIKGIIGLPTNLFYGTGIPACIIVLDKENSQNRTGIFMIDASKAFMKDGNKNRLREQDIHKIVDVFNNQLEVSKYSRMVFHSEISDPKNDYNLNIPRYIDSQEEEDIHNIEAHLLGGIPDKDAEDLSNYWEAFPSLKQVLFAPSVRAGFNDLHVEQAQVKKTIFEHLDFTSYSKKIDVVLKSWREKHLPYLKKIDIGVKPKETIMYLSEDLLQKFSDIPLIDRYDIYQSLLNYWKSTMQDDVYQIADDGWKVVLSMDKKKKTWDCDLLPKYLVINKFFQSEQKHIEKLEADREAIKQQITELEEEHAGEEGLLSEAKNDKDKISKASVQKRMKEVKGDKDYADELELLEKYLKLSDSETVLGKQIKDSDAELDKKLAAKYKTLTTDEIKGLVVDDKWMTTIETDIKTEVESISQRLSQRIKELAERYESTLSDISGKVMDYEKKVHEHLIKMGFN
ncbi:type I restriction-modification system, M subunit [sediment metagenome]|uniref:site-specific DNA-methyltransferase (adenine-specific) n=1 Tax=sediment metagenome TaxID=749907 RepID=D9PK00_9ZZZZ